MKEFPIGYVFVAKENTQYCNKNEVGIVYYHYSTGRFIGINILFESGRYCGWDETEIDKTLKSTGVVIDLDYKYTNVIQLLGDFRKGVFTDYFLAAKESITKRKLTVINTDNSDGFIITLGFDNGDKIDSPSLREFDSSIIVAEKLEQFAKEVRENDS